MVGHCTSFLMDVFSSQLFDSAQFLRRWLIASRGEATPSSFPIVARKHLPPNLSCLHSRRYARLLGCFLCVGTVKFHNKIWKFSWSLFLWHYTALRNDLIFWPAIFWSYTYRRRKHITYLESWGKSKKETCTLYVRNIDLNIWPLLTWSWPDLHQKST